MEARRTRDITDRTPEISSPLPALLFPALPPWATISRGDYSGEEKAPERRLRVATDITVTHTRSRSRILSGISSEPNRRRRGLCRDAAIAVVVGRKEKANRAHGVEDGGRKVSERDGEISFLGY